MQKPVMDDVSLHSLNITPNWKRHVELRENSTITDQLSYNDGCTDPMEQTSVACETTTETLAVDNVQLTEEVVSLMEREMSTDNSIVSRLNGFHVTENVRLQPVRTMHQSWLSSESADVISFSCDSFGRMAFLLGGTNHETWCSHEAKIVLVERSKVFSLPLLVCPSCSNWSTQSTAAVGLIDGQVILLKMTGEIARNQIHSLTVTAIEWVTSTTFVSCSYDGTLVISQLKSAQIEQIKSIKLSVADLPKRIRNNSSSGKPVSLVALSRSIYTLWDPEPNTRVTYRTQLDRDTAIETCVIKSLDAVSGSSFGDVPTKNRHGHRMLVASETGGTWLVSVPDLELSQSITNEPAGISNVLLSYPFMAVTSTEGYVTVLGIDGSLVDVIPHSGQQLFRIAHFLISTDNETILIYDLESKKIMMEDKLKTTSTNSNGEEVIVIDERNTATLLRLIEL